jgi:hypothetical protein
VTLWLSETDSDALYIEVAVSTSERLDLRYNFVRTGWHGVEFLDAPQHPQELAALWHETPSAAAT